MLKKISDANALPQKECAHTNVFFMQQDDDWVRNDSALIELGSKKFLKSVMENLFKTKKDNITGHHYIIKTKTSTKSTLSQLAKPFEPMSLNSSLPLPSLTNNSLVLQPSPFDECNHMRTCQHTYN